MKSLFSPFKSWWFYLFSFILCGPGVFAQSTNSNLIPIVTVRATQPIATATKSGVFTLFRAGNTNFALNVWYELGGSASNSVDYAPVAPHLIQLAAGATSNSILIKPLAQTSSSGTVKTVILTLTNSPLMTPINYEIGSPSRAVVYIEGAGVTNLPPTVNIIDPRNGDVFYTPTNIILKATAYDSDGSVTNVEFFAGTNDLGSGIPVVLDPPGADGVVGLVYLFNWRNPSPGKYPLTAMAADNDGATTTSDPVKISVLQGPPPTNVPPIVRIVSPANGAVFRSPINLPIYAYANDADDFVASVEFFSGTKSLGFGRRVPVVTPLADGTLATGGSVPPIYPTNLFFLVWSNAAVGTDTLTALATDNGGLSSTSAPVNITILPPLPPPTNRSPIVNIVATDPVAVEGTNWWVWRGETNSPPTWAAWPKAICRWFTNCAPKTATFTVRRSGDTNGDLTVPYIIGGTASNGVDYVALPGVATIHAGERRALITIVPIDDGPPFVNKTVVLTLVPSTATVWPPPYLVGIPGRAAAIIVDRPGPQPVTRPFAGHCFHFHATGPNAAWFCIEYSTNLVNWTAVCTNQVINGSIDFVDPDAAGNQSRFYRAIPLASPPEE